MAHVAGVEGGGRRETRHEDRQSGVLERVGDDLLECADVLLLLGERPRLAVDEHVVCADADEDDEHEEIHEGEEADVEDERVHEVGDLEREEQRDDGHDREEQRRRVDPHGEHDSE